MLSEEADKEVVPIASFDPMEGIMTVFGRQEERRVDNSGLELADVIVENENMAEILIEELLRSVEFEEKEKEINSVESEEQIVVHDLEGPYLMRKCN